MIFITGAARSGTSLTAKVFKNCGAKFDQVYNNKLESIYLKNKVIKPYLESINCDARGQNPLPKYSDFVDTNIHLIDGCYKEAKIMLMWPIFVKNFPKAKWIIVERDTEEHIGSLLRTPFMTAYTDREGWLKWINHHNQMREDLKQFVKHRVVKPREFIEGTSDCMKEAVEWCGLTWNPDSKKLIDRTKYRASYRKDQ